MKNIIPDASNTLILNHIFRRYYFTYNSSESLNKLKIYKKVNNHSNFNTKSSRKSILTL